LCTASVRALLPTVNHLLDVTELRMPER